jgi:tripartite-type tricarboxylate transporter receptor subunit TctC
MKKLLFAAAFAVALQNATGAMADGYPSRPIVMVVPLGVGGSTDDVLGLALGLYDNP